MAIPDDCYKYGSIYQAVIYNKYTMECVKINSVIIGCKIYSDDLTVCL